MLYPHILILKLISTTDNKSIFSLTSICFQPSFFPITNYHHRHTHLPTLFLSITLVKSKLLCSNHYHHTHAYTWKYLLHIFIYSPSLAATKTIQTNQHTFICLIRECANTHTHTHHTHHTHTHKYTHAYIYIYNIWSRW